MRVPKPLSDLIESFQKLPGIGPKSAQRLAYYLLHVPQSELDSFAQSLMQLKRNTVLCSICKNAGESDPCLICSDEKRENILLVVEQPLDVIAFEKTHKFNGLYHVLHGVINPLDNIGPDEIFIPQLFSRIVEGEFEEIIIATNPTMEGDATAMYISKKIKDEYTNGKSITITRLGMGIPTGADLEYADSNTLTQAIEGRRVL